MLAEPDALSFNASYFIWPFFAYSILVFVYLAPSHDCFNICIAIISSIGPQVCSLLECLGSKNVPLLPSDGSEPIFQVFMPPPPMPSHSCLISLTSCPIFLAFEVVSLKT